MPKNYEINKYNYNINNNKYFSNNNSLKKNNNRINNFNKNSNDKEKRVKSSKSVSYIEEKEKTKKVPKKYSCEKYNSRNDIRNDFIYKNEVKEYKTDKYKSIYVTKNKNNNRNFLSEINNSSINGQRTNIKIKKIDNVDKNDYNKNFYNIYSKPRNIEQINDIKKNLFLETNDIKNDKKNENLIHKNYSVTNNLVVKNKRDNGILSARNLVKKNNKDNSKIIKKTHIKFNIIKTIESLNNKSNINIHQTKSINNNNKAKIYNKIKYNNNKININKKFDTYKYNNINNISVNIKINNSNNNIINVNNNFIENNRIKRDNFSYTDKKIIKHKEIIKKNYINIKNNLNNSIENNLSSNKRKNHMHIISELDNNNNMTQNSIIKKDSKINNNINIQNLSTKLYDSNNNLNQNHYLTKNHSSIRNNIKISDNNLKKQNIKINTQKNTANAIKEIKDEFHSDDYNIIDLIGEGTYGKIYLVKKNKTNEIYALKQISLKSKIDSNKYKKEYEFLMKLTEEDPNLNIINILGLEVKQLDKFNTVLYILMEAGKSDWEKEVYKRNLEQRFYTEDELIDILSSLVSTFSSLQKKGISHRDVKPQNIVFFEKNKNRKKNMYKITDFGEAKINKNKKVFNLGGFDKNTSKQTVRGTELYMSPLLFNALRNTGEIDIQYNPYKSDVYSLGLCILLAASLSYIPLYQIREINKMDKIKNIIEGYLCERYSKEFINLLLVMLQINEKFRPDFIELNSWITNHYN